MLAEDLIKILFVYDNNWTSYRVIWYIWNRVRHVTKICFFALPIIRKQSCILYCYNHSSLCYLGITICIQWKKIICTSPTIKNSVTLTSDYTLYSRPATAIAHMWIPDAVSVFGDKYSHDAAESILSSNNEIGTPVQWKASNFRERKDLFVVVMSKSSHIESWKLRSSSISPCLRTRYCFISSAFHFLFHSQVSEVRSFLLNLSRGYAFVIRFWRKCLDLKSIVVLYLQWWIFTYMVSHKL